MNELHLVTGGAGFIGSHLVETLVAKGLQVRVFDNFSTGLRANIQALSPGVKILDGDLRDKTAVLQAAAGVSVVYHLGALPSVQRSVENSVATHEVCATGTLHGLDAARRNRVRRVVYASRSSVYGGASKSEGQTEDTPPRPCSPYAAAKLAGEYYAEVFATVYALEMVSLRFFNIFGPRQRAGNPYSGVIAVFIAAMTKGRRPVVHGDGLQSRDFTYVANAVQAMMSAAETDGVSGRAYDVGTGRSITILDLVATLNRLLGTELIPQHVAGRPGDFRYSCADISAARRELKYEPTCSFEDGLKRAISWVSLVLQD
jgi:UDP-glucose 4-epimerase